MQDRISDETELIQTYLAPLAGPGSFGLSDDAARIPIPKGYDLVVSTDPIRAGVHFFPDDDPRDIAGKALAVNFSDLIAKGATPIAYTLALSFPEPPLRSWMEQFSAGLQDVHNVFSCWLLGGDTDRTLGPLSISVSAFGFVPAGRFVRRTTARLGDHVFVTGTIGDAALGLKLRRDGNAFGPAIELGYRESLIARYLRPGANVRAIDLILRFATAALDVSDGLMQDAARLAQGAGAQLSIPLEAIPLSPAARRVVSEVPGAIATIAGGGDDYVVLFSVSPDHVGEAKKTAVGLGVDMFELGVLQPGMGATLVDAAGTPIALQNTGYDHFRLS